jgi:hypothetical protein
MTAWTVRDSNGQLIADFAAGSRLDVGRKLVPTHYDSFRLHVSSSYRQLFDRALSRILAQKGWEIVCIKGRYSGRPTWPHRRAKACR